MWWFVLFYSGCTESDTTETTYTHTHTQISTGFEVFSPFGSAGKEPACQCRRHKRLGFHPWAGEIHWRRARQPTPVFLPGKSHGQRSLGAIVYGNTESDTNKATKPTHASGSFNDSTLQRKAVSCSCPCCVPMLFLPSACWFVVEASGEILWGFHESLGTVNLCLVGLDSTRVSFLF